MIRRLFFCESDLVFVCWCAVVYLAILDAVFLVLKAGH